MDLVVTDSKSDEVSYSKIMMMMMMTLTAASILHVWMKNFNGCILG